VSGIFYFVQVTNGWLDSIPSWDDVARKLSFRAYGNVVIKVGDWGQPLRVEVNGAVYTDWSYDSAKQEVTINNLGSDVALLWKTEETGGGGGGGGIITPPTPTTPVTVPTEFAPLFNLGLIIIAAVAIGLWAQKKLSADEWTRKWAKTRQKSKRAGKKWKKKTRFE
jgi:hypothetical protein